MYPEEIKLKKKDWVTSVSTVHFDTNNLDGNHLVSETVNSISQSWRTWETLRSL